MIGGLMIIICVLAGLRVMITPSVYSDPEHQAAVEQVFLERSEELRRRRAEILQRYVPKERSVTANNASTEASSGASTMEMPLQVNINTAGLDSLLMLPGIGPAYAERILKRRQEVGGFTEISQLMDVKGIGPARFEKIRPLVTL